MPRKRPDSWEYMIREQKQNIIITKSPTFFGLKVGQNLIEQKIQVVPNPILMKN